MTMIKDIMRFIAIAVVMARMVREVTDHFMLTSYVAFLPWKTIVRGPNHANYGAAKWVFWCNDRIKYPMVRVSVDRRKALWMVDTMLHEMWHLKQLQDWIAGGDELVTPRRDVIVRWFGVIDEVLWAEAENTVAAFYDKNQAAEIEAFYVGRFMTTKCKFGVKLVKRLACFDR